MGPDTLKVLMFLTPMLQRLIRNEEATVGERERALLNTLNEISSSSRTDPAFRHHIQEIISVIKMIKTNEA